MAELRMREALRDAMAEEMRRDEGVFVMGEDVAVFQGAFKVTEGLLDEFGERRVRDTPISENTIVGAGVGAAMGGLRPIVELMTVNFSLLALDQIVNHAAAIPYMFNGQARVPMVIRMPGGGGHQLGPTHSHSFEALYLQVPGLLVACPSTPADGKALLKAAIRDDNPVIFIEHESLYGVRGEVPEGDDEVLRFGEAAVRREGGDVTIVGVLKMAQVAEQAAAKLAAEHGVEAEVIDPRTLRPLDLDTILESVAKTNRAVIVEEGWPHGGVGANLATLITEQAFDDLDAPVQRVTGADVHMPYSKRLEQAAIPHEEHVVRRRWRPSRGRSDGRDRHAAPLRLDGGGHDPALAEAGRGRGRGRRRDGRNRDRQGEHGLRERRGGDADRDPGRRRGRRWRSGVRSRVVGDAGEGSERPAEGRGGAGSCGRGRGFVRGPCPSPPTGTRCSSQAPRRRRSPSRPSSAAGERIKASPVARRMAGEKGVDLASHPGLRARRSDREGRRGEGRGFRG